MRSDPCWAHIIVRSVVGLISDRHTETLEKALEEVANPLWPVRRIEFRRSEPKHVVAGQPELAVGSGHGSVAQRVTAPLVVRVVVRPIDFDDDLTSCEGRRRKSIRNRESA